MAKARFLAFLAAAFSCAQLALVGAVPLDGVLQARDSDSQQSQDSSVAVVLNGVTYRNKGIVAFGRIPSNFRESTGDTLGGIGSAIAFKHGTWKSDGTTFSGTLLVHPDRGFNVESTIDYQARQHEIDFVLSPYYGSTALSFTDAQKTLQVTYKGTTLQFERNNAKTTGLDAVSDRKPTGIDPDLPLGSKGGHLTLDVEGLVALPDGTFFISDEYGPYLYQYSADGQLIRAIQPPKAILPHNKDGDLKFTSEDDPHTGRAANQGFEGLTIDPAKNILYAMLQTAAIQDGGDDKSTARYTRMVAFDVSDLSDLSVPPPLVGEWVVPLPLSDKGNAQGCSEIHFVSPGVFLALARDGDGAGGDDNHSKYKNADLFSIADATDIHGSKFDDPKNPIADDGKLNKDITPAKYVSFVSYIDETQIERFSLRNDDPDNETLIDAKWESLALAPVNDPENPDDYFLFTASDNDFLSTDGVSLGKPFNAGQDVDNQFLVFQVTLPGVDKSALCSHLGAQC